MVKKTTKLVFSLKHVSTKDVINEHFGNNSTRLEVGDDKFIVSNVNLQKIENSENVSFPDILHETDKTGKKALYFFDSRKAKVKTWPVMIETTQKGCLPLYTTKPCRRCSDTYNTHPIGCPIKYNKNLNNKDDIRYQRIVKFLSDNNLPTDSNDFFETEYMFCTWPCLKSYIFDCMAKNPHSHKYKNSLSYMTLMYKKIHGITGVPPIIPSAGPLSILEKYGGHMTIEEYRSSFGILEYNETVNIRRPYMFSCSAYIEEIKVQN